MFGVVIEGYPPGEPPSSRPAHTSARAPPAAASSSDPQLWLGPQRPSGADLGGARSDGLRAGGGDALPVEPALPQRRLPQAPHLLPHRRPPPQSLPCRLPPAGRAAGLPCGPRVRSGPPLADDDLSPGVQVPSPIPEGLVASVYVSMYPYATWRCLGAVSNAEPSKILNVQWPESDVQDQASLLTPHSPLADHTRSWRTLSANALCSDGPHPIRVSAAAGSSVPDRRDDRGGGSGGCGWGGAGCAAGGVREEDRHGPHDLHGVIQPRRRARRPCSLLG